MPLPIRFEFIHKETGKTVREFCLDRGEDVADLLLTDDGYPGYFTRDMYQDGPFWLRVSDWKILVATHQDNGEWVYQELTDGVSQSG